jgi:hypothetical protein
MNRTQQLTCSWLHQSGLDGDALLLEALLRRGFLAYSDSQGVWLGTGSHSDDVEILQRIDGLFVEPRLGHQNLMAHVKLQSWSLTAMDVASAIVGIPENRSFIGTFDMPADRWGRTWATYRKMIWGNKISVCPTKVFAGHALGYIALDIGVALLVKVLPLARCATHAYSCDGHGGRSANVKFRFIWDSLWGEAVFGVLASNTQDSAWTWAGGLRITPTGFRDAEIIGMLNDIQAFSRRLLHQSTIDKIGMARARTLDVLGDIPPTAERFVEEAKYQLDKEFHRSHP